MFDPLTERAAEEAVANQPRECSPIPPEMHCRSVDSVSNLGPNGEPILNLNCLACSEGFIMTSTATQSTCSVLQPYQKEIKEVSAQSDICELRHPENGLCLSCPSPYIFDADFQNCSLIPSGVPNCEVYLTENICSSCASGFFLSLNECKSVATPVANCYWYSADGQCKQCEGGFELDKSVALDSGGNSITSTVCQAQAILNCSSYDHKSGLCSQCETGFFLARKNTVSSIEPVLRSADHFYICQAQNIENCSIFADNISVFYKPGGLTQEQINYLETDEFPLSIYEDAAFLGGAVCERCVDEFYLKDNACFSVSEENKIKNCLEYTQEIKCRRCAANFILSKEK